MSDWRIDVLKQLRLPLTASNLQFLSSWGRAEGGGGIARPDTARFNWLNTTKPMPGSTRYNSVGVQNFANYQSGVRATAATLGLGYYDQIRQLLARGGAPLPALANAVYASPWGTKHGIGGIDPSGASQVAAAGGGGGVVPSAPLPVAPPPTVNTPLLGIAGMTDPRAQSQALLSALVQRPQQAAPVARPGAPRVKPSPATPGGAALPSTGVQGPVMGAIKAAMTQIGQPYVWGGESRGEGGFDCSGLIDWAFRAVGVDLPGRLTTYTAAKMGSAVNPSNLQPGDLILSNNGNHMTMYVGGGKVIAASSANGRVLLQPISAIGKITGARRLGFGG